MPLHTLVTSRPRAEKFNDTPCADTLRTSEIRYRRLFEAARDGILILDAATLEITDVNPYMIEMLGFSRAEFLGKELWEIGLLKDETASQDLFKRLQDDGYVRFEHLPLETRLGRKWDVEFVCNIYEEDERHVVQCNIRDITERVQIDSLLQSSEERLRMALEVAHLGTWDRDIAANSVQWSSNAEAIFGFPPGTYDGRHETFLSLIHPADRERMGRAVILSLTNKDDFTSEYRVVWPDGSVQWVEATGRILCDKDGVAVRMIGTVLNITQRKADEEQLQLAKIEAEIARDEAQRANLAKSEFIARMSHELRTPLNSILGFGQLLAMDELNDEQSLGVGQILKGGNHLLELVDEVLDIASIEAGRLVLSLAPVNLEEVLGEALDMVRPMAGARRVELGEFVGSHRVLADRARLKQVLLNLLSNAVKFNREGGQVALSCQEITPGRLRIEVSDTGAGIAPDDMAKLFLPFERLGAEKSEIAGTGIGLSLSKRLTELMGGTISAQSVVGEGSRFWLDFPLVAPVVAPPASARDTSDLTAAKTVLCIEDNSSNLHLITSILRRRPEIELIAAREGRQGFELALSELPALILLDMQLPDIHGAQVLELLQNEAKTRDIPVIVLSADANPHQITQLLDAGARGYLTKPLDVKQFLEVLDESLESSNGNGHP